MPTSTDQRYGTDSDDLSQWQSEFRGQIRALRHWLNSMEMRLPPPDPTEVCLLSLRLLQRIRLGGCEPIVPGPQDGGAREPWLCGGGPLHT
ncbi:unnamed protein product [Boreogadus saida]